MKGIAERKVVFRSGTWAVTALAAAVMFGGCTSSGRSSASKPSTTSPSPVETTVPSPTSPATTTTLPEAKGVSVSAVPQVGFDGDTISVSAVAIPIYPSSAVAVSITRINFGDGATVTLHPGPCQLRTISTGQTDQTPPVTHMYSISGQIEIQIWSVLGCGSDQSNGYSTTKIYLYSKAPAAASTWPRCQPDQLTGVVTDLGAAAGSVAALVTLHNTSGRGCHLYGYPGLQLIGSGGRALTTRVTRGAAMLFPSVVPHLVGLEPDQTASFEMGYSDEPIGTQDQSQPYSQACPPAVKLAIIPPDDYAPLEAATDIAPCNRGAVTVSPIVPGAAPIPFR